MYIRREYVLPVFNQGQIGVIMGAALISVAYEGFELIPNAVNEMRDARRDLTRGIFLSIVITIGIYVLVSLVAVGNLLPDEIAKYEEYALAVASWIVLIAFLWRTDKLSLAWIGACYSLVIMAELLYSELRLIFKSSENFLRRRRKGT